MRIKLRQYIDTKASVVLFPGPGICHAQFDNRVFSQLHHGRHQSLHVCSKEQHIPPTLHTLLGHDADAVLLAVWLVSKHLHVLRLGENWLCPWDIHVCVWSHCFNHARCLPDGRCHHDTKHNHVSSAFYGDTTDLTQLLCRWFVAYRVTQPHFAHLLNSTTSSSTFDTI